MKLFITVDVERGALRMVPITTKIVKPSTGAHANIDILVGDRRAQLARCVDKTCVAEFWVMRHSSDKKICNMKMETYTVAVTMHDENTVNVKIPCAVNSKPVHAFDELVVFKPAVAKQEKTKHVQAMMAPSTGHKKQKL